MFGVGQGASRFCTVLILIGCYFGGIGAASAQLPQGRWAIGSTAACATKSYLWRVTRDEARFVDQLGSIDVERVVQWLASGFNSVTVASMNTPLQTRWEYRFLTSDTVQVRNLTTGKSFILSRCPEASHVPAYAAVAETQATSAHRIGPGFDCSLARDALSGLICGNDQLAWLDLRFAQAYQALRQEVGETGQAAVRQEAVDFQTQVYAACRLPKAGFVFPSAQTQAEACVTQAYQQQRNLWAARLSLPLQEEADRPLQLHLRLQAALQSLGFIPPTSLVDGVYGPATRAAISAWQVTNNFPSTGVLSASDAQRLMQAVDQGMATAVLSPSTAGMPEPTAPAVPDEKSLKAAEDRQLAIRQAEAEKARFEAEKAQADAERARVEAEVFHARERIETEARRKAAEQAQAEQDAQACNPDCLPLDQKQA